MHDFHLADQIINLVLDEAKKNKLSDVSTVFLEVGSIVEHGEEINLDNLKYNLKLLAKNTLAEKANFKIKKTIGNSWNLVKIEGDSYDR